MQSAWFELVKRTARLRGSRSKKCGQGRRGRAIHRRTEMDRERGEEKENYLKTTTAKQLLTGKSRSGNQRRKSGRRRVESER